MRYCSNCVLPETMDTLTFDKNGVCSVCNQIKYKKEKIDWNQREKDFKKLIEEYRGKGQYDCIIPFSGGKDSTFQAYTLVRKYNLKPLIVSFDHGFYRTHHLQNVDKVIRKLGVDYLKFRPSWYVVKKLMLESLKRKGDFCWHCHTGIYAYPMQIAVKYNIPLIIWGESLAEYQSWYNYATQEEVDEERFNKCMNLGITAQDMIGMLNDPKITMREMEPFAYPSLKELKRIKYKSICLGSYMPWDTWTQSKLIQKELEWEPDLVEGVPPAYNIDKTECILVGVRDYLKFIKRGFGRTAHLTSIDIRNKRLTREKAIELVNKYDGKRPSALDVFLKMLDITEDEFNEIVAKHVFSPYEHNFSKTEKGKELYDIKEWIKKDY